MQHCTVEHAADQAHTKLLHADVDADVDADTSGK